MTRIASVVAASLLAVLLVPAPAPAAVSCQFDEATGTLSVTVSGSGAIQRGGFANGVILVGETVPVPSSEFCVDPGTRAVATITNTDSIQVEGTNGDDFFAVSHANGPFAPGDTTEVASTSEIEMIVELEDGFDIFEMMGGPGIDRFVFGAGATGASNAALAFNSDADSDIGLAEIEVFIASGAGGGDILSGQGLNGTGDPIPDPVTLLGEGGDDFVTGGSGDDGLTGGPDRDVLNGAGGADGVTGDEGVDTSRGGPGIDVLENISGDDTFEPGPDDDIVIGVAGARETVSYRASTAAVNVNLGTGIATGEGTDDLTSVENATGSAFADDLFGNATRNVLEGRGGDDDLRAQEDNDTLKPGPGTDFVRGGPGIDTLSYAEALVPVDVSLTRGTTLGEGTDTLELVENIIGTEFADRLTGSTIRNLIAGGFDDDDLFGLEGNDDLFGQSGNDDLNGGPGADLCVQDTGTGTLSQCENVGTFELKPRRAEVSTGGERLDYLLTWTHPRRWRRLDTVELRIRDGDRVPVWVRWNEEGNTFQMFDPGEGAFRPAAEGGTSGRLRSPFAVLHLGGSDAIAFDTQTIGVVMRLSFRPGAVGSHTVEATAEDDRGNRMAWERAGTLKVRR